MPTPTSTATVPAQSAAVSRRLTEHPNAARARELIAMHEGTLARLTAKRDSRPATDRMRDIYTLRIHEVSGWIASLRTYLTPARDYAACPTCAAPGGQPCTRTCRSLRDDYEQAD